MAQEGRRDFVKHSFFKVSSEWRRLPLGEREHSKNQFAEVVAEFSDRIAHWQLQSGGDPRRH